MTDIRSYKELFKVINQNIQLSLEQVGKQVQKMVKDYILEELYRNHQPTEYDRTFEFLNSVSVSKVDEITKGKYTVQIYFDLNKIFPMEISDSTWNQHMDIWGNSQVFEERLILWLEQGTKKGLYPREGIHSMETIREDLARSKEYVQMIKEFLEKKGFQVELKVGI